MVTQRQVAIVVDSGACLPAYLVECWQITVVPHILVIEGVPLRDGLDITPEAFYRLLREGRETPTTSAPSPAAFLEAYAAAGQIAPHILCIVVAMGFSASYDAALAASEEAKDALPGMRIDLLDSRAAAGATGLLALSAAQAAAAGDDLEQVVQKAKQIIPRLRLLATLDSLRYLSRSGRVSRLQAWAGSTLGIKPIFELRDGQPKLLEKPRSRRQALGRLLWNMRTAASDGPLYVNVMEADAAIEAEWLRDRVDAEFDCREIFVSQFTPVMGAHTGPGLLGVAFYSGT